MTTKQKLQFDGSTIEVDLPLVCKFASKGKPRNIIVALHGYGDNAENFAALAQELPLGDVLWVCPQGPELLPFAFGGAQWYSLQGDPRPGIKLSQDSLNTLLETLSKATGILSKNIFLFGFSQGAYMALQVGLTSKQPLAGIIALSGYCGQSYHFSPAPEHVKQIPLFVAHGANDQVVFPHMFYQTLDMLDHLGCNRVKHKIYPMEHSISNEEIFDIKAFIEANR